jgi:malonyl-CoA decarboxylase
MILLRYLPNPFPALHRFVSGFGSKVDVPPRQPATGDARPSASLFKRLVRSVVDPVERARMDRSAKGAVSLCHGLLSERGEVSGAALARDAVAAYHALPQGALPQFFDLLVQEFSPEPAALERAYEAYRSEPSQDNLIRLQHVVEPPRQEMFRRLNMAPGGTATLVAMRRFVLSGLKSRPEWKGIDADLSHLFGSWFNRGFLTLERIDWHTPAIVLEKLIKYEAVHEITSWQDLHRRLEGDRRCFAFFHPALPNEPLIFIEVALTKGTSAAVQPLLDLESPELKAEDANTAIFYSITNCQEGLRGISFGNLLIKQVAQRLGQEFPRIKTFATLSPVPGFRSWLTGIAPDLAARPQGARYAAAIARLEDTGWYKSGRDAEIMRQLLLPLAAYYLVCAKHNGDACDPVARFHLGNGARLERLNWLADTSRRGLNTAAGMMVNYRYRLDQVEENHEIYVREQRVVASRELQKLARECPLYQAPARH